MTPQTLNHDDLLEPISAAAPTGRSLRNEPLFDRIVEARREEPALSQGAWSRPLKHADWHLVEELCRTALATRSKDLQLAVWLAEAWLRLFGLPGFTSGVGLIVDLHDRYLVDLLPAPSTAMPPELPLDPEDPAVERRLNLLQWLNENLAVELKLQPLSSPRDSSEVVPVSLADLEASQYRLRALQKQSAHPETVSADAGLARSLQLTPPDEIVQTGREIAEATAAVEALGTTMDRCYGDANAGVLQMRDALEAMAQAIAPAMLKLTPPAPAVEASAPAAEPASQPSPALPAAAVPPQVSAQALASRAQAYAALAGIADYLEQLEPHSPVPYLLRRAVTWGSMSLRELLPELLQDPAALNEVGALLRID